MAIDIGDAVLTFLGDTTQLDAAFNKVATETGAKLAPVAATMDGVSAATTKAGTAAQAAANDASALDERFLSLGQSVYGVKQPLKDTEDGLKLTSHEMHEAKGTAALVNDAFRQNFGINLPRHVRSFLAELPGVSTALSAAFSATAILFLIEALVQGIEKIQEWAEHGDKIKQAWEKYDQTIFESSTHMQGEIEKQKQKLIEMTQGPVAALDFALKHLQTTAFETFSVISKDVAAAVAAMNEASSSLLGVQFNVFKDAGKDLDKFKDSMQKAMREAAQASPDDPFAAYNAGIKAVQEKERELTALITQRTAASGKDASAAVDGLHAERQAVNDMLPLLQKGIELQKLKNAEVKQSDVAARANDQVAEAKRVEGAQLASIELVKAQAHLAFSQTQADTKASETTKLQAAKEWAAAETKAANDSRAAHEEYLAKVEAIYKKAGETVKAHAATEELSTGKMKDAVKVTDDLAKENEKLATEQKKWDALSQQTFQQRIKETKAFEEEEIRLAAIDPLPQIAKNALHLNDALKGAGVQGLVTLRQNLGAAEKAEKALNDAGVHGGKIWLEVQAAKLKAIIAVRQAEGQATIQELKDLKKLENEIKAYDGVVKGSKSEVAAAWTGEAIAAAAAADSIGAAAQKILQSVLSSLAGMAFAKGTEQLALAFAAMSPISPDFGHSGEHFASAAEWFALGTVASVAGGFAGGGGGGGSSKGGSSSSSSITPSASTQPAQNPVQSTNIAHLATGGLVDTPMLAEIGHGREAVLPLDNHEVMRAIGQAIGGSNQPLTVIVEGIPMHKFSRVISSRVNKGQIRVKSSDGLRVTRRY